VKVKGAGRCRHLRGEALFEGGKKISLGEGISFEGKKRIRKVA